MSTHGYQPYKPTKYTRSVLKAAKKVLYDYEAHKRPLTVRQVFYRLVAEYGFDKTEKSYGALVGYMARSRRAYQHAVNTWIEDHMGEEEVGKQANRAALADHTLIPFGWVRDERGRSEEVQSFDSEEDVIEMIDGWVDNLQRDRQDGQPYILELWCEAAGMVPLMKEIAKPYGIRVSSGGGYDSVTAKHKLAVRAAQGIVSSTGEKRWMKVLHIGDFDPSGEGMFNTLTDDVGEMVWQLTGVGEGIEFIRVGLTEEQVIERGVETAPPKPSDSRRKAFVAAHPEIREHLGSDDITAQLEALTPDDLEKLIEEAIEENLDHDAYEDVLASEHELRTDLRRRLRLTGFEEEN